MERQKLLVPLLELGTGTSEAPKKESIESCPSLPSSSQRRSSKQLKCVYNKIRSTYNVNAGHAPLPPLPPTQIAPHTLRSSTLSHSLTVSARGMSHSSHLLPQSILMIVTTLASL